MKHKNLAMLLALLMLASSVTACGEAGAAETTADTAAQTETEKETTELEARLALPDNLPEIGRAHV